MADSEAWSASLRELRDLVFPLAQALPVAEASLASDIARWVARSNAALGRIKTENQAYIGGFLRNAEVQLLLALYNEGCGYYTRARSVLPDISPLPSSFDSWRIVAQETEQASSAMKWTAVGIAAVLAGLAIYGFTR